MADVPDRDCRGWMSWEVFRCRTDCTGSNEGFCVDETTYKAQADALVSGGFRAAGCARSLASQAAAAALPTLRLLFDAAARRTLWILSSTLKSRSAMFCSLAARWPAAALPPTAVLQRGRFS